MDRINVICIISGGAGGSELLKSLYKDVTEQNLLIPALFAVSEDSLRAML